MSDCVYRKRQRSTTPVPDRARLDLYDTIDECKANPEGEARFQNTYLKAINVRY